MPHSANPSTSTQGKMSRPTSTSYSANAFPRPAGTTLVIPETAADTHSPSPSQFSFASTPHSAQDADQQVSPTDTSRHMRPITRPTPGEGNTSALRTMASQRSRAQFFEDSFAYKDGASSTARERVTKDAPIVAELRTNVIIKDEYTLVTDLSHHLSTRYQRPESSIMITVNHSACLLLGGSFEPTYILTINALPIQVQPTLNKRNAALIQNFMCESIGVTPDRGIVKFMPIPEDSLAMNGMTILGEIERLERQHAEEMGTTVKRAMTKSSKRSAMSKAKSSISLSRNNSKAQPIVEVAPALSSDGPRDSVIAINEKDLDKAAPPQTATTVERKKSEPLISKFSTKKSSAQLSPPPIPDEQPVNPQISKRKSFLRVFTRRATAF